MPTYRETNVTSAASSETGLLAGRYRLLSMLGRGGMGRVWHARDQLLDRDVAIKEVLAPPELAEEDKRTLFRRTFREARAAARLNHPNVVTLFDVVEQDGRPWIVMELVQAPTLEAVLRADGPRSHRQTAELGLAVFGALRTAHRAGVVHRDVKPSNVMVGDNGRTVLTDFGIATLEGDASLTVTGMLMGSPAYIAPERIMGTEAGPEADLWSTGATLYAAVEGRPPYDRGGAIPTLAAVVADEPDPPRYAGPLAPVLLGLLRKDPAARMGIAEAERLLRQVVRSTEPPAAAVREAPVSPVGPPAAVRVPAAPASAEPPAVPPPAESPPSSLPAESSTAELAAAPSSAVLPPAVAAVEGTPGAARASAQALRDVAPAGTSDVPVPPGPSRPGRTYGRRRGVLLVAALAVLVLAGTLGTWWLATDPADRPTSVASGPTAKASPTAVPRSPATAVPPAGGPTPATVPAGFRLYRDPSGFSLAVPVGWTKSQDGHIVYFREPNGGRFLLVDQTDTPKRDAVADWTAQEAARRSGIRDYRRVRIVERRYFLEAADWEFTHTGPSGGRQHVVNRGFVTAWDRQAYGLYWSTPEAQWQQSLPYFEVFTTTFRPRP